MSQLFTSFFLSTVVVLLWGGGSDASSGLLWEVSEPSGGLVRSLTDGVSVVTLEYTKVGELVQCWHSKKGRTSDAVSLMFYSAMSDDDAVRKTAIEIDIKEVMKHCKSYMNKTMSASTTRSQLQEQIEQISMLRDGFDGSKWCGLSPKGSKVTALKREDRCCKKWQKCALRIDAYSFDYMMYNYKPYSLQGCNCTVALESCLRNLTMSSLAEEILDTQFVGAADYMTCLTVEKKKTNCVEWDNFYHTCKQYDWATYGKITNQAQYVKTLNEGRESSEEENTKHNKPKNEL